MGTVPLPPEFTDAKKAREVLEAQRWPDGPVCPHCGLLGKAYKLKARQGAQTHARDGVYKCAGCRKQFTVTVGTIFEDSHVPLNKWLLAIHLLCASKKGISAHQLHRMLRTGYRTAWFMAHRIRYAMEHGPLSSKLLGTVELDENYVGGKSRTGLLATKPGERSKGRPRTIANMAAVALAPQHSAPVQSRRVERVTAPNLRPMIKQMVGDSVHLMTEISGTARSFSKPRHHNPANHKIGDHARIENGFTTSMNGIEGVSSTPKHGTNGVHHQPLKHELQRHSREFDFRYNAREVTGTERAIPALGGRPRKRLLHRGSCAKA